jgi:oligopeptide/dipeptide ABC transporter ATP-binding protein
MKDAVLSIKNLTVSFKTEAGIINAVEDVSFDLKKGETLGIVGESGCGKSVTALSILRLLPKPISNIESGEILFDRRDIVKLPVEDLYQIRGKKISMIFQEPMTALNPVHKIGDQIKEIIELHNEGLTFDDIRLKTLNILDQVGIPEAGKRIDNYPHELSGGMRQRVLIAMALVCEPEILIADEPTTALDVTIQAQILELIKELKKKNNMSVVFITHDLGVIAEMCDSVVVMYAGKIAERANAEDIFYAPAHPYTKGLLSSIPRLENEPKSRLNIIKGIVPSLAELPAGCRFENRCPYAFERCKNEKPELIQTGEEHFASCFLLKEMNR